MKTKLKSLLIIGLLVWSSLTTHAAVVFSDDFAAGSTLNSAMPTAATATSAVYQLFSSKAWSPTPTLDANDLRFGISPTTSGHIELQARFANAPLSLMFSNDFIELTVIFTNTSGLFTQAGHVGFGLYNSGGVPPLAGGLNGTATNGSPSALGGAQRWRGYAARIAYNGGSHRLATRPAQTILSQDLITEGGNSQSYTNGVNLATTASTFTRTAGSLLTEVFRLTRSNAFNLRIESRLYLGGNTNGTMLVSQTATATGANFLNSSFDSLAVGWRATASTSATLMDIKSIAVNYVGPSPLPIITLYGGAIVTNECHTAFTDPGATATNAPLAIAGGSAHGLALKSDGTVAAWGAYTLGQTNIPEGLSNVVAIAGGGIHSLALKSDGKVVAWGSNVYGQTNVPVGLSNVVAIAGGDVHSLALKSDGKVVAWGYNGNGETNVSTGLSNVVAIAGGASHSLALKSDGTVAAWGYNGEGETNIPAGLSNVVAIAGGVYHSLVLKSDGKVVAWGYNGSGQTNIPAGLSNVVAIAVGGYHNLALKSDGTVIAWGAGTNNSGGFVNFGQSIIPMGLSNVVAIAAGDLFSLALKTDGTIAAWGRDDSGQTNVPAGLSISLPVTVSGSMDTNTPGSYLLTYTATNSLGVVGRATRTVVVQDTLPPVITLLGANPLTLMLNTPFVDPGATALDVCGGSMAVTTNSTVNIAVPGTYAISYTATDSSANAATETRWVQVVVPPVVTLNGDAIVTNECHAAFTDPGATATGAPLAIAGGAYHSLALRSDGTVVAWGAGTNNTGAIPDYGQSIVPAELSNAVAIAGGTAHSLALRSDGTVVAWGDNSYGQTNVPVGLSNAVAVAVGSEHNLALRSDGTVAAWGRNDSGQTNVPAGLSNVVAVAGGGLHSLALRSDGTIVAWGDNSPNQTVPVGLSNVMAIAACGSHNLALKSDGTVSEWGFFIDADSDGEPDIPAGLSNVVAIAAGSSHSLALKSDGTIVAWGLNDYGQTNVPVGLSISLPVTMSGSVDTNTPGNYLFTYTATNSSGGGATATRIVVVQDTLPPVITVLGANPLIHALNTPFVDPGATALDACGGSLAVATNSNVNIAMPGTYAITYIATDNSGNSVTNTRTVQVVISPVITLNGDAVVTNECHSTFTDDGATAIGTPLAIAGGSYHSLALKSDGTVVAWGNNGSGQTNIPVGLSNVVAIAGGESHSLALKNNGTVTAWGFNGNGETNIPVGLSNVVAIAGRSTHSLALKSDGTVAAWGGYNVYGELSVPTGLSNVVAIAAGGGHSLALKSDGTVAAWGANFYGQTSIPAGLSNVVAIAGGYYHNLALKRDGTIAAWGYNAYGQTNIPVGLSNVVAIAGGGYHSLALKSDGTVAAWGWNQDGQTNVPAGLSNVVAIAGGGTHTLALKNDGMIVAWGDNTYGQTNVPLDLSVSLPVVVSGIVDTITPNSYQLTYTATNSLGGIGAGTRTVVVQDTLPPVITLLGANPLTNMLNDPFIDLGATALDACGGSLAVTTNSNVNIAMPGMYAVTYTATDNSGNTATNTRTVQVVALLPVIASQPQSVTLGCGSGPAIFSVTAFGEEPLTYQWYLTDAVIPGATATNYMVNFATPANAGGYTVIITNAYGAVTSSVAMLALTNQTPTVIAADSFSLTPGGTLVIAPSALTGNDTAGTCGGSSTPLTFLSFSPISANGGSLVSLPPGTALWTNRYNGGTANAIAVDGSGNVFVTGGSSDDYATIAYSGAGVPLWTNRYNGPGNNVDQATAVAVDSSGNVFATGYSAGSGSSDDYATVAYNGEGVPLWTNRYNAENYGDRASAVAVGTNGNVYVTGYSYRGGSLWDYVTVAYNGVGVPLWTNRYNGSGNNSDYAYAVAVGTDGNVYVTGTASGSGSSLDYATVAYNGDGVPLWANLYNGPGNSTDWANAVAVNGSGNVFVTGYSYGSGSDYDYATVAYNNDGLPLWTNRYNGPGNNVDLANAVAVDTNGNVYVTGASYGSGSSYDYATVAYNGEGVPLWTNRYTGTGGNSADQANAVAVDGSGNVFVTGYSYGSGSGNDYATICYSGGRISYTPTNGFTGVDTFTYVMQDGYGLNYTGTVSVAVGVVANTISTEVLPGGEVLLGFYGTPGQPYALERVFDLTLGDWTPQQTNTAAANGALSFTNLPAGTANFWRIRSVP